MTDSQQPFGGPLADAFQILRQRGGLRFGGHSAPVFFPEGFFAAQAEPALMAVARAAVFNNMIRLAMGAVHAAAYNSQTRTSIPI